MLAHYGILAAPVLVIVLLPAVAASSPSEIRSKQKPSPARVSDGLPK